jgi:hypothetical protein
MGRSEGQAGARDWMNRFVALVLASLLVGCAHTSAGINSSGTAAGGTTSVGAQVTVGASGVAAVAVFAIAAAAIYGTTQPAPELDGSRRVNEQDCSKPIQDRSANLKCR